MTLAFRRLGPSELLPRYIFAEHLFVRRRVLEVGAVAATAGESAKFLVARGARTVLACDDGLEAVAQAQRTLASPALRFRSQVYDDLESGSFDLVLVADLAPYVRAPLLLKELARLVAPHGYLLGGLRNAGGLALSQISDPEDDEPPPTYGQLVDALTPHFPALDVATQSPLLGYQLAMEATEGLQVDGTLAGTPEAAYFVVLAGQEKAPRIEPTWVQLPPAPIAYVGGRLEEFAHRARGWEERHGRVKEAWEKARQEADAREVALVQLRGELERSREEAARSLAQLELRERKEGASRDADELSQKVRRLEAELQVSRERAEDAEKRTAVARNELEGISHERKQREAQTIAAHETARLERARRDELLAQLEDARERATQAHEAARREQEAASEARLELERAQIRVAQAEDGLRIKTQELVAAREREIALAEAHSVALAGLEGLRRELVAAQEQAAQATHALVQREADLALARRAAEGESQGRSELELRLRDEIRESTQLRDRLEGQLRSLSTELAAALDERQSLAARVAAGGDAHALAQSLEARLAGTNEAAAQWEARANELGAQAEVERARANRLERDGEGLLAQERIAREALEETLATVQAAMAEAEARLASLSTESDSERAQREEELESLQREVVSLGAATQRAEAALEEARQGQEAAERALGQLRGESGELRAQAEAHAEAAVRAQEELQAQQQNLTDWESRWQEGQTKLREALDAQRAAEAAVAQARAREEVLEKALEVAESTQATAQEELALLRAQSQEGSGALEAVRQEAAAALEVMQQETAATIEEIRQETAAAVQRATDAEARAAEVGALAESKGALASELVEARSTLEAQLAVARTEAEQFREEVAQSAEVLAKLEESNRGMDDERRRLIEARENLAAQLADLAARDEGLVREGREKDAELQRTLNTLRLLEANQERERAEWEKRVAKAEAIQAQLQAAEGQKVQLTQQLEELTVRVQAGATADQQRVELASMLQVEERERGVLKRQLEEAAAARDGFSEQLEKLEAETLRLMAEARREKNANEKAQGELDRLRAALKEAALERQQRDNELRELTDRLSGAEVGAQREAELTAKLAEKESRWEVLQRRLTAQEAELTALRRVSGRAPSTNVQQIYERATAELSQVKAEMAQKKPPAKEPAKPTPPPVPPPGKKNG